MNRRPGRGLPPPTRHEPDAPARPQGLRTLQVSRTTARFLADGHPWVRPDRYTRGLEALSAGEPVTLVDEGGRRLASALSDPAVEVCARVYHRRPDMPFVPAQALSRALERRAALLTDAATDSCRLVHGEGDFLPGVRIERYGPVIVVLVLAGCAAPYADALCRSLSGRFPAAVVVLKDHREDLRREPVSARRYDGRPLDPEEVVQARELGVLYPLRPYGGLATGLYVDQRATRAWLRPLSAGKRVLNLFSYTGAFSLAALHAGAAAATDIDLSAVALARAQEGAALNGVAGRLRTLRGDCREVLASLIERFDIIIADPPTAAQGAGGWVLRRDYGAVLRLALGHLAPGGLLVACCNTIGGKPFDLAGAIQEQAGQERIPLQRIDGPPLGEDLPQLEGFPEGRPFRLVAMRAVASG